MAPDLERELERTTALRGFRYGLHDFVAAVGGAEALQRHNDNTQATYLKQGLLDRKTKELLIIVACVASGDLVSHIQIHMPAAQKGGSDPGGDHGGPKLRRQLDRRSPAPRPGGPACHVPPRPPHD